MTKKLEDLLNLPDSKGIIKEAEAQEAEQKKYEIEQANTFRDIAEFDKIASALPASGGIPIQANETDSRNGGLVVFTSTDQSGNFRIGDGVVVNQQTGTISGTFYSKSLFSTMTPFILALGGD